MRVTWSDDLRAGLPGEPAQDAGADRVRCARLAGVMRMRRRRTRDRVARGSSEVGCERRSRSGTIGAGRLLARERRRRARPGPRRASRARRRRSGGRAGAGGRRPPRRTPSGAGTTIGRLPFASATMTEPTPACVTTTRARADRLDHPLEGEEVDDARRPARSIARRVPVLDRRAPRRAASSATARSSRSKRASFVPTVTKIMRPPRRRCRRSARRAARRRARATARSGASAIGAISR